MNSVKVYTAPSAKMLLLVPTETLAASDWGFNDWTVKWHNNTTFSQDTASGVGIVNGGLDTSAWAEDGYTLNKSS